MTIQLEDTRVVVGLVAGAISRRPETSALDRLAARAGAGLLTWAEARSARPPRTVRIPDPSVRATSPRPFC